MKPTPSEPARLVELRAQDDAASVARLVRSAMRAPAEPVPRLKSRIRHTLRRKSAWRRRYVRLALVGGILFLTGGVVGAVVQPMLHRWQERAVAPAPEVPAASPGPRARHRRVSAPSAVSEQAPFTADEALPPPDLPVEVLPTPPTPAVAAPAAPPSPAAPPAVPVAGLAEPQAPRAEPVFGRAAKPSPRAPLPAAPVMGQPARRAGERAAPQVALLEPPRHAAEAAPSLAATAAPSPAAAPVAAPPALPEATPALGPRPATPPAPTVAPKPVAPPPPSEQALLSRALRSLRAERRPASALAVLDEYQARFPNGSLVPEATRLRTEALLALGEKPAALAELQREPTPGASGGEERQLVRGELHAAAGRWHEALTDFDAVVRARVANEPTLGPATSAKLRERLERALWGRASARSHLGDDAGARLDLRECLRRFPQGRFAGQAAHLLGERR